jgi:hypothetical protein
MNESQFEQKLEAHSIAPNLKKRTLRVAAVVGLALTSFFTSETDSSAEEFTPVNMQVDQGRDITQDLIGDDDELILEETSAEWYPPVSEGDNYEEYMKDELPEAQLETSPSFKQPDMLIPLPEGARIVDVINNGDDPGFLLLDSTGGVHGVGVPEDQVFRSLSDITVLESTQGRLQGAPKTNEMMGFASVDSESNMYYLATITGNVAVCSFTDTPYRGQWGKDEPALNGEMVGFTAVNGNEGYYMVAKDGGIFSWGNAPFHGSMGGERLNKPMVGMIAAPNGEGYFMYASDGGVFAFGDAPFFGSLGGIKLNAPIVGAQATFNDEGSITGYRLVAADGGTFSFGDAPFLGSFASEPLQRPIVGFAADPRGNLLMSDEYGRVYLIGDDKDKISKSAIRNGRDGLDGCTVAHGQPLWDAAGQGLGVYTSSDMYDKVVRRPQPF